MRLSLRVTVGVALAVAVELRVHVEGAAGDDEGVETVEVGGNERGVVRQRHGQAAAGDDGIHVVGAERIPRVARVAPWLLAVERDADERPGSSGHRRVV